MILFFSIETHSSRPCSTRHRSPGRAIGSVARLSVQDRATQRLVESMRKRRKTMQEERSPCSNPGLVAEGIAVLSLGGAAFGTIGGSRMG